jgi:ABC-type multidrug transport system fused ATPase/permease subunit
MVEVKKQRSWPRLLLASTGALRWLLIRRIRGQHVGEAAEADWREAGGKPAAAEPAAAPTRLDAEISANGAQTTAQRLRAALERFVERQTAVASTDRVHFSRRRAGWEDMVERKLLRRVWVYFQPFKWQIILLLGHIGFAVAVGVATPWITKIILDAGVLAGDTKVVFACVGAMLVLAVLGSLNMRAYNRRTYSVSHQVIRDFRTECNNAIERLDPRQFTEVEPQQVATLTQENVAAILQLLSNNVLRTIVGVAVAVVLLFVLLLVDWRIAALGAAALPINMVLQIRYRWRFRRAWHRVNEYYYHIKDLVSERVEHHEVYRAFGIHKDAARETDSFIEQNRNVSVARDWVMADWNFFIELTGHLCNLSIMALTAWMAARGQITPGMFMMLVVISAQLYVPILDAYGVLMNVQGAMARISDTFDFIDRKKERVHEPLPPARHPKNLSGAIEVRGVGFGYVPGRRVLHDVNVQIEPGQHVGIIGRTGSGKTTLFRLIAREYEPDEGTILFDGYDYRQLDVDWFRARQLAVVLQDPHLINSRVGHIIRMGDPTATPRQVMDAARRAEAHDFISRLPEGYNTLVGPHGTKLSVGERQRLSIARAALRDPRILILDEATSNLDNITEARVQRALERLMEGRTTLAISHRWTTLQRCYPIYCVLDDGHVISVGSYDELLEHAKVHGEELYNYFSQSQQAPA